MLWWILGAFGALAIVMGYAVLVAASRDDDRFDRDLDRELGRHEGDQWR